MSCLKHSLNSIKVFLRSINTPEISAEALYLMIQESSVQIVDVRTKAEWEKSHIDGSHNLPISRFSISNIEELSLDKNKITVTVCLSAHRSIPAVKKLKAMGYREVYQLKGGMKQWWKSQA